MPFNQEDILGVTNPRVLPLINELSIHVDDGHNDLYMLQLHTSSEDAGIIKYTSLVKNP